MWGQITSASSWLKKSSSALLRLRDWPRCTVRLVVRGEKATLWPTAAACSAATLIKSFSALSAARPGMRIWF